MQELWLFALYVTAFLGVGLAVTAVLPPSPLTPHLPRTVRRWWQRFPSSAILSAIGKGLSRRGPRGDALRARLSYAGSGWTVEEFAGIKILGALGGCFVYVVIAQELVRIQPLLFLPAGLLGFIAPEGWLQVRINRRKRAIIRLLPDVIDLLSLCVGAGLDFLGALNKVLGVKAFERQPLIEELAIVSQEVKFGKRRAESLKAMAQRVALPEVSSFVRTLVQADRMGTPMVEVLAIHAEDVRLQRWTRAERAALKAPIKILIPLIFCIMPCVAIIVGAPIFIQFLQQNPFGR